MIELLYLSDFLYYFSFFIMIYFSTIFITLYLKYFREVEEHSLKDEKRDFLPTISFVIPLYNDEENIVYCLSSILTANYPQEKIEVIVVDDASKDNSYERAKMFEEFNVKVLKQEKNGGAAKAKNKGLEIAKGEIVITMDSDSVLEEKAIKHIVGYFKDREVAAVSSAIRTKKPKNAIEYFQMFEYDLVLFLRKILESVDSIPVTPGGMSAFRKAILDKIGYFDEKSLTEDEEIAFKIHKHHYKIKSSLDSFVYTEIPSTFTQWLKQRVRWTRGSIFNRIKHKDLFDVKYGDFIVLGFLYQIIFPLPYISMLFSFLIRISIEKPYFFLFRINFFEEILSSLNLIFFVGAFASLFYFLTTLHMINNLRKRANQKAISLKEFYYFIPYLFIYPTFFMIMWFVVFYKAIKKEGYVWGTR